MEKRNLFSAMCGKNVMRVNMDEEYVEGVEAGMDMTPLEMAHVFFVMSRCPCMEGKTMGDLMEILMNDDGAFEELLSKEYAEAEEA